MTQNNQYSIMSETISANNKRIAKNTLMLYFRMIIVMCVSIYTSRVYLAQLGISDYGTYNVVGGIVAMFSFLNGSLAVSTQRNITFALGKGDKNELQRVFAASFNIHLFLGFIIVLILESFGLWYVNTMLVVSTERLDAVNYVYQFSIVSSLLTITQVPYSGLINAHEDMGAFSWLSILDVIFKLLIAFLISKSPFDRLVYFGLLLLVAQIIMISIYRLYSIRHYEEAHIKFFWDKLLYKSIFSFAFWNVIGGLAWMMKNHGTNLLLNLFFGTVINSARGIAMQVSLAVNQFSSSFLAAVYPQITKYYAQGKTDNMFHLTNRSLKFSFYIIFCLSLPILLNIESILSLWLVETPPKTNIFVIWVFVEMLIQSIMGSQLSTMISSTGDIKNFQIVGGLNMLLILPISYVFLKGGYEPESVFIIIAISGLISGFIRLYYAHKQTGYSYKDYILEVLNPVTKVLLLSLTLTIPLKILIFSSNTIRDCILLSFLSFLIVIASSYFMGITKIERINLNDFIKSKLR